MKKRYLQLWSLIVVLSLLLAFSLSAFATEDTAIPPEEPDPSASPEASVPSEPAAPEEPPAPQDTTPPVITHSVIANGKVGSELKFEATASDDVSVAEVRLLYRIPGTDEWTQMLMTCNECGVYSAILEAASVTMDRLEYYMEASDGTNVTATQPAVILMDKGISVTSLSSDKASLMDLSTPITILGEGFAEGMVITVGGIEAAYTLVSETELQLTLPVLPLGKQDIVFTHGENSCCRLAAITYEDPASFIKISAAEKVYIGQKIGLPISISSSASITELTLQVQLDPNYFKDIEFILGTANADAAASCMVDAQGLVTITLSSLTPLTTADSIGYITASIPFVEKNVTTFVTIPQARFHGVDVKAFECPVTVSNEISISLLNLPETMYALEGMIPEFADWLLEIDYEGPKATIPVTADMISLIPDTLGQAKVTYFHKEIIVDFTVLEKALSTITIKTPPAKLHYIIGESLDLTGMELELSYNEGQLVLPLHNYTVSGFDSQVQGEQTVTITYGEFTNSFQVTVFLKGDINRDGKISILDMVSVKSHVLGVSELTDLAALAADYNGDGKISILDYVQIKAFILGITTGE